MSVPNQSTVPAAPHARVVLFLPHVKVLPHSHEEHQDGRSVVPWPDKLSQRARTKDDPHLISLLDSTLALNIRHAALDVPLIFDNGVTCVLEAIGTCGSQSAYGTGLGFLSMRLEKGSLSAIQDTVARGAFHRRVAFVPGLRLANQSIFVEFMQKMFADRYLDVQPWPDARCWVAACYCLPEAPDDEQFRQLVDVDEAKGFGAANGFASQWLAGRTYERWPDSRFGFTHHSLVIAHWPKGTTGSFLSESLVVPDGHSFRLALYGFILHKNWLVASGTALGDQLAIAPTRGFWISHFDQCRALWKTWQNARKLDGAFNG